MAGAGTDWFTRNPFDEMGALIDGFNSMIAQRQERDATLEERVQAGSCELANSLSLLNATLESTADGILVVDHRGKVTGYNSKFGMMWRIPPDAKTGDNDQRLLAGMLEQLRTPEAFLSKFREMYAHPDAESRDLLETKDGRLIEGCSQPQRLEECCVGRVWNFRDVTECKKAEQRIAAALNYSQLLLNTSPIGIITYRASGETVSSNPAVAQMIGAAPEQVAAQNFRQLESWKTSGLLAAAEAALATRRPQAVEVHHHSTFGKDLWISSQFIPFEYEGELQLLGLFTDVSERKRVEQQMLKLNEELLDTSRQAGMAEMATSVLHNTGNVLTSVNICASLITEQLAQSRVTYLGRIAAMLQEHADDLPQFLAHDSKGRQVPSYLAELAKELAAEQNTILKQLRELRNHLEHIREIVRIQQNCATVSSVTEQVQLADLVDDALKMNGPMLERRKVRVTREFSGTPKIQTERHKVLQILVNLIRNAVQACEEPSRTEKRLTLQVNNGGDTVRVGVTDNGVGISAENLARLFNRGFTTKKGGHGFGLHSSALVAKELGGTLRAHSDGPGRGATFTLELPIEPSRTST